MKGIDFIARQSKVKHDDRKTLKKAVTKDGKHQLPAKATRILYMLATFEGEFVSKERICEALWGRYDYFVQRSFDVHVSYMRKFLIHTQYKLVSKHKFLKVELKKKEA
jgi:DNA-binding response OmpR family regulator